MTRLALNALGLVTGLMSRRGVAPTTGTQPVAMPQPTTVLPEDILVVRNLNAYYGNNHVLKSIILTIPRGKVTALIGPSGCGKSTFLRMFNRMNVEMDKEGIFRHTGDIHLIDESGLALDVNGACIDPTALRRMIGMVFQKPNPFPQTIYKNVAFISSLDGVRGEELDEIVETSLKRAALWDEVKDDFKKKLGPELSGGQQQRLCIARALASDPDILLLDEPCSALDPTSTTKIEDLIFELSEKGITVVIVTHNMEQARRVSNKTAFFYMGELVEFGDTKQIFMNPKEKRTKDYVEGKFG